MLFSAQVPAAAHARTSAATVRTLIVSYTTLPAAADAPAANAGAAPATNAPTTSRLPTRGAGRRWPRRCKPNRTGVSAEDSRGSDAEGRRAASAECRHTGFGGAAPHAKHEISLSAVTLCVPNAGAVSVSQGLREPAGCNVAAPPAVNTYARTRHGCIAPLAPNLTVRPPPVRPLVAPFVSMRACLCAKLKGPTSPKARSGRGMGVAFWTMAPLLSLFVSGAAAFRFPLHPPAAHQLLGNPMRSVAV